MTPRRWLYDTTEDRLFLISGDQRQEVPLSPQQHRLVAYMVRRNQSAAGTSVLCERGELIDAVWPDESGHSPQDLAYVVHQLRGRVDSQGGAPTLILNERGRGYRLLATSDTQHSAGALDATPARARRRLLLVAVPVVGALAVGGLAAFSAWNRPSERILREGSRGQDVVALQRDLIELGYDPVYVDGQYGPLTATAVRAFQQDHGQVVDGEVGPETRAAMRQAFERRTASPQAS